MALTRSMLNGMGLTAEQVSAIIEAHSDTVDGLKAKRDEYKADAEKLAEVQKELDELKAKSTGSDEWETKYNDEHKAFEDFKKAQEASATKLAKENAYKKILKDAGISEKRIDSVLRVADLNNLELSEDGTIVDADKLTESVKTEWADFITSSETSGANTEKPPVNESGNGTYKNKSEIMAIKDRDTRRQAIKDNPQLFGLGD